MTRARDNKDLGSTYKETPTAGYDGMATLGETRGDLEDKFQKTRGLGETKGGGFGDTFGGSPAPKKKGDEFARKPYPQVSIASAFRRNIPKELGAPGSLSKLGMPA